MWKIIVGIIVVILLILLVWQVFLPPAHVVRLIDCDDSPLPLGESQEMDIKDSWFHAAAEKVKFKNDSQYDGVQIEIPCTDFFVEPASELVFTLGVGESKTLTMRDGLQSEKECNVQINPSCVTPGPTLIKKP